MTPLWARAVALAVRTTWGQRRWGILVIALVVLGGSTRFLNPWDLMVANTSPQALTAEILPAYLFLEKRELHHPWEALVAQRLGETRAWWLTQVAAAGVSALIVTAGVAATGVVIPLVTAHWSWAWGPFSRAMQPAHVVAAWAPWGWSLDALGLMALGLWASGALLHLLTLWWQGPWLAWLAVVLLGFLALTLQLWAQFWVWWIPGPQFALLQHWAYGDAYPAAWSVGYAVVLLTVTAAIGVLLLGTPPWETTHGGTLR